MPSQFFAKVDSWWKAGLLVFAIISAGVAAGVTAAGYMEVPSRLAETEAFAESNESRIAAIEQARAAESRETTRQFDRMQQQLDRLECLVVAGRRDTPIEDCL